MYIRVYSGEMKPGETYTNTTNGKKERIARFYRMMGDKRIALEKAGPGDIVAAMGLADTFTGQHPVRPGPAGRPGGDPVPEAGRSSQALSFSKTLDSGKVGEALNRLVRDDPTLKTHTDEETKDTILSGMGELHLEISIEKLKRAVERAAGATRSRSRSASRGWRTASVSPGRSTSSTSSRSRPAAAASSP